MVGLITEHLVRRGVQAAHSCLSKMPPMTPERGNEIANDLIRRFTSTGALVGLGLIMFAFVASSFVIEYSIRYVATTLAVVEDNEGAAAPRAILLTGEEPDAPLYMDKKPLLEDVDGQDAQEIPIPERAFQPVTRKLRTTLGHLKQTGGFRNIFRGVGHAAFYLLGITVFTVMFRALSLAFFPATNLFGVWAAHTLAAIFACNLHASWTHAMIAERDEKTSFLNSYLGKADARKLVLPTLRLRVAMGAAQAFFIITMPRNIDVQTFSAYNVATGFVVPIIGSLIHVLGLVLPAYIALIRCEASLLPETSTPIVPFDRTFGGKLVNAEEVAAERGVCAGRIRFRQFATFRGAFDLVDRKVYKRVLVRRIQFIAVSAFVTACFAVLFVSAGVKIAGGCQRVMEALMYARAILKEEFNM